MPILVKGNDVRSGTKANASYGRLKSAQASMGLSIDACQDVSPRCR